MNYSDADAKLTGRNRERRKLANNTYLERRAENAIAVRLHSTDILTYHADDSVTLNSGGWRTVTTKARMNDYIGHGLRISQERGQWYIWDYAQRKDVAVYADGMTIRADGTLDGAESIESAKDAIKLRRRVHKYAKDYVKALRTGEVGEPSNGDCWGCLMVSADDKHKRSPMGGKDHILSHMEEKYYVPSLLTRAFEEFGASVAMKDAVARCWKDGNDNEAKFWGEYVFEQTQKAIARYCLRELGQAA